MCIRFDPIYRVCRHRCTSKKPSYEYCEQAPRQAATSLLRHIASKSPCSNLKIGNTSTGVWCSQCEKYLVDSLWTIQLLEQGGELDDFREKERRKRKRKWNRDSERQDREDEERLERLGEVEKVGVGKAEEDGDAGSAAM